MTAQELLKRINENGQLMINDGLSEIERDILLHDLRDLYTMVKGKETVAEAKTPEIKVAESPVVVKEEPVVIKQEPVVVKQEPVVETPVVTIQEVVKVPIVEEKPIEVEIAAPIIEVRQTAPVAESTPAFTFAETLSQSNAKTTASLNDIFSGEEKSLNEKHSSTKKPALNDQAARKDLKSLIDLNKQFVIINELFKGDGAAFQSTIDRINASPTVESAFEYLKMEIMPKYQWSGEMQSARLFDKLVRLKFGV